MTEEHTQLRALGYWSELAEEQETDGGESALSPVEWVREATEEEWSIHSVILADQTEETLFLLVIRSRVGDSGIILSERYFSLDREDPSRCLSEDGSGYSGNGIERRVSPGLAQGLLKSYARVDNAGFAGSDESEPLLLDAGDASESESLRTPMDGTAETAPAHSHSQSDSEAAAETGTDLAQIDPDEAPRGAVICGRCEQVTPREDAVQFSSGPPLGEIWIHKQGCPDGDSDE